MTCEHGWLINCALARNTRKTVHFGRFHYDLEMCLSTLDISTMSAMLLAFVDNLQFNRAERFGQFLGYPFTISQNISLRLL